MQEYRWPAGGITTGEIIYGCMEIGGSWDDTPPGRETRDRAFTVLDAALEAGYTMFDHADIYCRGKSETLFGEWLSARGDVRDRITIQSKCGIILADRDARPSPRPTVYDFSYDHIVESVDGILSRLGIERIDVLLLHRPDPLVEPEEVARAFDDLHGAGKVRSFGVSNHSAMQIDLLRSATDYPIVANQMEISLAHPDLLLAGTAVNQREPAWSMRAADTVEYCRLEGVTLQAWSPLGRGIYSGREENATARLVERLAAEYGVSREAIVLAWIMRHPAPVLPIVGSTNTDRIAAAAEASGVRLSREHWYLLAESARGMGMP